MIIENELKDYSPVNTNLIGIAKAKADREIMEIYNSTQTDDEIKEIDKISNIIRVLNHAKTYSFILCVFVITLFCVVNIENFGK